VYCYVHKAGSDQSAPPIQSLLKKWCSVMVVNCVSASSRYCLALEIKQKYVTCLKLGELTVLLLKLFILVNVVAS